MTRLVPVALCALVVSAVGQAKEVGRLIDITLDHVASGEDAKVGDHNFLRMIYDDAAVNPRTRRVPLLNLQHPVPGGFAPLVPDATEMPVNDAWLELAAAGARVHYRAAVVHGKPIVISLAEGDRRFTLRDSEGKVLLSGSYRVATESVTGPDIERAAGH